MISILRLHEHVLQCFATNLCNPHCDYNLPLICLKLRCKSNNRKEPKI
jgi:hypothetical protein